MKLTIEQIKEKIEFCKAMINIEPDKKRKEFIAYFNIDTNNIGEKAWGNDEIDSILNRAIEELIIELNSKKEILELINQRRQTYIVVQANPNNNIKVRVQVEEIIMELDKIKGMISGDKFKQVKE